MFELGWLLELLLSVAVLIGFIYVSTRVESKKRKKK